MATHRTIHFRRKREGKTDYRKRLKLLEGKLTRLVIRKSLKNIMLQVIEYNAEGDKVIVSASSKELSKIGWKFGNGNIPAAYLTGLLLGKKAKEKKIKNLIFDIGLATPSPNSRLYATLKGVLDYKIEVPHSEEILPDEDILSGKNIAIYAESLKNSPEKYKKQFSGYLSKRINPEDITNNFEEIKKKIMGK